MQDDPPEDEPDESQSKNSDASGIIEDEIKSTDGGSSESEIHYGTKRFLQAFFPFAECWFSGGVEARDIDLGEFLNDVEDDPRVATMLGTANEFDLDAEGSSTDAPSQSANLASSQAGDTSGTFDDGLFGDELSIEQISEATKWPFYQKSRPEDYAEELPTASRHRGYSTKYIVFISATCTVVTFLIAWLACVILLLRYG